MTVSRAKLVKESLSLVGVPYLWWAKGDMMKEQRGDNIVLIPTPTFASDCSGAVGLALKAAGGPDVRWSYNTDSYWNLLPRIDFPSPGDVALYGGESPTDVSHIEMVIALVEGMVVVGGSSGGDSKTTTLDVARTRRACYKVKHTHLCRTDFRGFRSMAPLLGQGT